MTFRASVVGIVAAGMVLLGNTANAATAPGASSPQERAGGNAANVYVTVVNVYGSNNTIATDRSVVAVADGTRLNANTGDVSSSGTLGIDNKDSAFESGASTNRVGTSQPQPAARTRNAPSDSPGPGGHSRFPFPVSRDGQSTSISGYEDHSVKVTGDDQIAVYDDSNLFVNRNGQINANTGDTDSSGLNSVDVSGSKVRSGDHIEGDEDDDDDEGDGAADDGAEEAAVPPEHTPAAQPATPIGAQGGSTGVRDGTNAQGPSASTSTVSDEGESNATGKSTLTIGADGYDDLGTELHGKRNIVNYDDSNVVLGGTGKANAQIGDSDTSGTVVMDIDNSDVQSGNST
ncbi:hypothetical protein GCM10022254_18070 [Actinomadura meridiana]|uniref:Uncharacterized protein n=1 Tax=Actinomadura meridiana TaxID=559626 RepID=A0ABP8BW73_9ACTN